MPDAVPVSDGASDRLTGRTSVLVHDIEQLVGFRFAGAVHFSVIAPEPLPRGRTVRAAFRSAQTEPGENACEGERHAQRTRRGRR